MVLFNKINEKLIKENRKTIIHTTGWDIFISPHDHKYYVRDEHDKICEVEVVAEIVLGKRAAEHINEERLHTMLGEDIVFDYCGELDIVTIDDSRVYMWFRLLSNKAVYNPHRGKCPYCGSSTIESHGFGTIEDYSISEHFICGDCEREWDLWFKLQSDGAFMQDIIVHDATDEESYVVHGNYSQKECEELMR